MTIPNYKGSLNEAFENRKFAPGELKFKEHKVSDPHLQEAMKLIAKAEGRTVKSLEDQVQEKIDKFKETEAKAPLLYQTIVKNIAEDTIFTRFWKSRVHVEGAPKFSEKIFWDLIYRIKAEHKMFLPMRSSIDYKELNPAVWLVPDPRKPDLNDVDTAAASPKGDFYFNRDFMQALINFSHLKGVVPKGKKYESNGGEIPDEYCWIEFLIMHEFMHYAFDDFHYQKSIPKANRNIINWVGDFRSNYLLVKSGYEQLPMGLFNDGINFDRQTKYKEMYDLVKDEFDKLNDEEKAAVGGAMDEMTDDHEKGSGKEEGQGSPKKSTGPKPPPPPPPPKPPKDDEEKGPYYVEDDDGNLTINGRKPESKVPNQTSFGNVQIGNKERWDEMTQGEQTALIVKKQDYRIDADGNIVVRVKRPKGVK